MIFSKSIKNIKLNKSAYEANGPTKQKQEKQSDGSEEEDHKVYSQPKIMNKKIHKVIVIGRGQVTEINTLPLEIKKVQTRVLNLQKDSNWKHDSMIGSYKATQTYGVFLRNIHSKVTESDLVDIIGEKDLLGIKISKTTGEMNFDSLASAQNAIELLNGKQFFGMQIKSMAQYELPKQENIMNPQAKTNLDQNLRDQKVIKVVKKADDEHGLRMNQKSESIFSRIQFKKD